MAGSAPTWLVEPCPDWCVRAHREDDHVEDRFHQGDVALVPVVASTTSLHAPSLRALQLTIRTGRHVGDPVTWVAIEAEEDRSPSLILSAESAAALCVALQRFVTAALAP